MENQPSFLDRIFHLRENGTTVRTEILAGITTFMTMAYILAVNPTIMSAAGMDKGAVLTATALASLIGTLCMAVFANYPFALAPGMGLNAFFAFTVVLQMGYTWEMALAAVFVEGIIFIVLSLTNVREAIFNAIPMTLKKAVSAGIGLFIALIGLLNAQIIVANPATKIALFSFKQSAATGTFNTVGITVLLAMIGIMFTGVLMVKKVRGNILWGYPLHMDSGHHLRTDRPLRPQSGIKNVQRHPRPFRRCRCLYPGQPEPDLWSARLQPRLQPGLLSRHVRLPLRRYLRHLGNPHRRIVQG